jgi:hypothetical protein
LPSQIPPDELRGVDMWKRVEFMKHAEEYWYLAKPMVANYCEDAGVDGAGAAKARRGSRGQSQSHRQNYDLGGLSEEDEEAVQLQMLLDGTPLRDEATGAGVADSIVTVRTREPSNVLRKFDETSMQQINDLIADFRKTAL